MTNNNVVVVVVISLEIFVIFFFSRILKRKRGYIFFLNIAFWSRILIHWSAGKKEKKKKQTPAAVLIWGPRLCLPVQLLCFTHRHLPYVSFVEWNISAVALLDGCLCNKYLSTQNKYPYFSFKAAFSECQFLLHNDYFIIQLLISYFRWILFFTVRLLI